MYVLVETFPLEINRASATELKFKKKESVYLAAKIS
jgi:hypothetical protein